MSEIKRIVLDVLKPHNPNIITLSKRLSDIKGISGVNCVLDERDKDTESVKITIEGESIDFEMVEHVIEEFGADIHSIDSVSTGTKIVDEVETPQDK